MEQHITRTLVSRKHIIIAKEDERTVAANRTTIKRGGVGAVVTCRFEIENPMVSSTNGRLK